MRVTATERATFSITAQCLGKWEIRKGTVHQWYFQKRTHEWKCRIGHPTAMYSVTEQRSKKRRLLRQEVSVAFVARHAIVL